MSGADCVCVSTRALSRCVLGVCATTHSLNMFSILGVCEEVEVTYVSLSS